MWHVIFKYAIDIRYKGKVGHTRRFKPSKNVPGRSQENILFFSVEKTKCFNPKLQFESIFWSYTVSLSLSLW